MRTVGWCLVVVFLCAAAVDAKEHSFQGLGDLTGQGYGSEARAVSADGSVAVGSSGTPDGLSRRVDSW